MTQWLARNGLEQRPRLAQELAVAPGWERAVETVLGTYLEAVCVDGIDTALGELAAGLDTGAVTLFDTKARPEAQDTGARPLPRLSSKLKRGGYLDSLFPGVRAAESLGEALAQRQSLHAGESIITRDGVWIGASWLRVSRDEDPHAGVLAREQELRSVREADDEQFGTVQALSTPKRMQAPRRRTGRAAPGRTEPGARPVRGCGGGASRPQCPRVCLNRQTEAPGRWRGATGTTIR